MSAVQTQTVSTTAAKKAPLYPFLSQPPPQKKRPTQPLPSPPHHATATPSPCPPPIYGRRRSATTSAITNWIANVHPGSPAPCSPRRSPSAFTTRRPSLTRSIPRRPSVGSVRVSSASFISFFDSPTTASRQAITPSVKEFRPADFTMVGYTSVFVQFPDTPLTPPVPEMPPVKSTAHRGLKHFRSLGSLKPTRRAGSRSAAVPPSPSVPKLPSASIIDSKQRFQTRALTNASIIKTKKSKYAKYRPAPLANELALAQLMDGGKLDDHVQRFNEAQAKANGAVKVDGQLVGVGGVYKDGQGGIWRDQDEEWEFKHLLGGEEDYCRSEVSWVKFGSAASSPAAALVAAPVTAAIIDISDERRESVSTQDSDLNPRYAMQADTDSHDDLAVFNNNNNATIRIKPGMSVLAIPSRNRRMAKHLRKPEFLLDIFPIPLPPSPLSPAHHGTGKKGHSRSPSRTTLTTTGFPKSPLSPRFGSGTGRAVIPTSSKSKTTTTTSTIRRRRPAPLKLTPPSPAFKCPTNPADDDSENVRRVFLDDSFAPIVPAATSPVVSVVPAVPVLPRAQAQAHSVVVVQKNKNATVVVKEMTVREMTSSKSQTSSVFKGFFKAMGGRK